MQLGGVTTEAVIWTQVAGCSVDAPNDLRKTAASGWGTGGGCSTRSILSGAGYVEWTAKAPQGTARMCGLSKHQGYGFGTTDYAIDTGGGGDPFILYWIENGSYGSLGTFATNDVFRVAVSVAGVVTYLKNSTPLRTSAITATWPLFVNAAHNTIGGIVGAATISGLLGSSGY